MDAILPQRIRKLLEESKTAERAVALFEREAQKDPAFRQRLDELATTVVDDAELLDFAVKEIKKRYADEMTRQLAEKGVIRHITRSPFKDELMGLTVGLLPQHGFEVIMFGVTNRDRLQGMLDAFVMEIETHHPSLEEVVTRFNHNAEAKGSDYFATIEHHGILDQWTQDLVNDTLPTSPLTPVGCFYFNIQPLTSSE